MGHERRIRATEETHDDVRTGRLQIQLVAEESDESQGWLEFIEAAGLIQSAELERLLAEANELAAIFSASVGTARSNEHERRRR
jgi:Tfp pilus assembly protein PilN